jgi:hypothetical protein
VRTLPTFLWPHLPPFSSTHITPAPPTSLWPHLPHFGTPLLLPLPGYTSSTHNYFTQT